jgi:hypothetical protein
MGPNPNKSPLSDIHLTYPSNLLSYHGWFQCSMTTNYLSSYLSVGLFFFIFIYLLYLPILSTPFGLFLLHSRCWRRHLWILNSPVPFHHALKQRRARKSPPQEEKLSNSLPITRNCHNSINSMLFGPYTPFSPPLTPPELPPPPPSHWGSSDPLPNEANLFLASPQQPSGGQGKWFPTKTMLQFKKTGDNKRAPNIYVDLYNI